MAGLDTCGITHSGPEKIGFGPVTCEKACHYFEKGPLPRDMRLVCLPKSGAQPNIAATIHRVSERATSEQGQVRMEGFSKKKKILVPIDKSGRSGGVGHA